MEWVLKRSSGIILTSLIVVIIFAWTYIVGGAGMDMDRMTVTSNFIVQWTPDYFLLMLVMWFVMMVAMMLPSAAPMILLFSAISKKNYENDGTIVPTSIFIMGYVVAWGGFSVVATFLQWRLEELALLTPMMKSASLPLGSALLFAAGVYQLTPLKHTCLQHCRSPIDYFGHRWRSGKIGALIMGLKHGLFCLGCCWVLMLLLFYGGIMNLMWIIGLAFFVLLEKVTPVGHWIGRFSGITLIIWATSILLQYSLSI